MTRDRAALLERIERELPPEPDAFRRLEDRRDRRFMRRRAAGGVVGVAITVVLVVGAVSLLGNEPPETTPIGSLDVSLVAGPGEFYYVRATWIGSPTTTNERWFGLDGSGRQITRVGGERIDRSFQVGELSEKFFEELSTDPAIALSQLIERSAPGGASPVVIASSSPGRSTEETAVLRAIQDLLTYGSDLLEPRQVRTLFGAAQLVDDVETDVGTSDPLGREATRLRWEANYDIGQGSWVDWFFDPQTGQFLSEFWVDRATGEYVSAMWVEEAGIVGTVDDRPSAMARYVVLPRTEFEGVVQPLGQPSPSSRDGG